ncbi:fungal-specific transcription factor domain-containing protein [Dendryphion nanum]|uniref:Fungal-specific transcription factor domain-containing protein n=1 Tax=Dendryphion nanum TaxID=256645 RepID=A0A9P9D179_9PLEO|nr:fungal-specific transcription factor domain-containing protein [Dendryphion nanum]
MSATFQSSVGLRSPGANSGGAATQTIRATGSRRVLTSNACIECRRRKIRCDGTQPCGQCQWNQHPRACSYSKPTQRFIPSRKLVDNLLSDVEQYKTILTKLYPTRKLDALLALPREELLELAILGPALPTTTSPSTSSTQTISDITYGLDDTDNLETLEQAPPEEPHWDEARKHLLRVQGTSDDVNSLSMSFNGLSSYVGISSIAAALKVIVRCAPHVMPFITSNRQETALPSRAGSPPPKPTDEDPFVLPPQAQGQKLVKSYFEQVHLFFPLIEEHKFWSQYVYGDRKDAPWLALLNMVFALGSLASSTADNELHYVYFNRSRQHLTLESFNSSSLEVLQALAIMSGYYMHYLNRPNEANSLMGGTLRMATALGLHREYPDSSKTNPTQALPREGNSVSPEMRRRIWWSLFCLDVWAGATTGRPSLGRMRPSITVLPPGATNNLAYLSQPNTTQYFEQLKVLPLTYSAEFCKVAIKIQDRLVESPQLSPSEASAYDTEIICWHNELPSILSNTNEPCPDFFRCVRFVMKWRFQNIRIVLHRPILLNAALRHCPFANLSAEEKVAVSKCRLIAAKTIEDISHDCLPDLISSWNAVWFTFQACMVPLVSLFSDSTLPEEAKKWRASIEVALDFFERSKPWNIAAKRTHDAVAKLYQAYKVQFVEENYDIDHRLLQDLNNYPFQINSHLDYFAFPNFEGFEMTPDVDWTVSADTHATQHVNGFLEDSMWGTNVFDVLDAPFGLTNDI